MSRRDFLSTTDAGLLAFATNFGQGISQGAEAFHLSPSEVGGYEALRDLYATRLQDSLDPPTRGERTIFLKNETKKLLIAETRKLARQIAGLTTVTDAQRQELGLTVRKTHRTPQNPPQTSPVLVVKRVDGRSVTLELRQDAVSRGKPADAGGATVVTAEGPTAPMSWDAWRFASNTTRTTVTIAFPPSATGNTVWISAFWSNAKDESGPAATPISVNLPAGGALPVEAEEPTIKLAA